LDIETLRVVNSRVVLTDSGDNTTFLLQELGSPVSDSTESLNDESLVLASKSESDLIAERFSVKEFLNGVENTESSRFSTSLNTTLLDVLSSAASFRVDILFTSNLLVGILNPGHNLFVGSHIGSKAIDGGTDEVLFDELHSVLTGYTFEFSAGESLGVNLDSTLGTTERNISDGELEGHEGSKSLNFLEINVRRVSGTTFNGKFMGGVLGSVAGDNVERSIVSTERDVESNHRLASLDEVEVLVRDTGLGRGIGVEELDLFEETRLTMLIELGSEFGSAASSSE